MLSGEGGNFYDAIVVNNALAVAFDLLPWLQGLIISGKDRISEHGDQLVRWKINGEIAAGVIPVGNGQKRN